MKTLDFVKNRLIIDICFANLKEKNNIYEVLSSFLYIKPFFFTSFKPHTLCDAYLLPSRSLIKIPQESISQSTFPILAFGPLEQMRVSLAYGIKDFIIYPFIGEELPTRIAKHTLQRFTYTENKTFYFSEDKILCGSNFVYLTYTEYLILKYLVSASPYPIQRTLLFDCLPNKNKETSRSLDMSVSKLRKKLKSVLSFNEELIIAERGFGYRIIKK